MKMHKMNIRFSLHLPSRRKVCPKVVMMNRVHPQAMKKGLNSAAAHEKREQNETECKLEVRYGRK